MKQLKFLNADVVKYEYNDRNSFIIRGDEKTINKFKLMLCDYYNHIEQYIHNGFFTPNNMQVCFVCKLK